MNENNVAANNNAKWNGRPVDGGGDTAVPSSGDSTVPEDGQVLPEIPETGSDENDFFEENLDDIFSDGDSPEDISPQDEAAAVDDRTA
jgi:hypothetical protein